MWALLPAGSVLPRPLSAVSAVMVAAAVPSWRRSGWWAAHRTPALAAVRLLLALLLAAQVALVAPAAVTGSSSAGAVLGMLGETGAAALFWLPFRCVWACSCHAVCSPGLLTAWALVGRCCCFPNATRHTPSLLPSLQVLPALCRPPARPPAVPVDCDCRRHAGPCAQRGLPHPCRLPGHSVHHSGHCRPTDHWIPAGLLAGLHA